MNNNEEHFQKIRNEMHKEALSTRDAIWDLYVERYRAFEKQLEDTNLSQAEKRSLTKSFDQIVFAERRVSG